MPVTWTFVNGGHTTTSDAGRPTSWSSVPAENETNRTGQTISRSSSPSRAATRTSASTQDVHEGRRRGRGGPSPSRSRASSRSGAATGSLSSSRSSSRRRWWPGSGSSAARSRSGSCRQATRSRFAACARASIGAPWTSPTTSTSSRGPRPFTVSSMTVRCAALACTALSCCRRRRSPVTRVVGSSTAGATAVRVLAGVAAPPGAGELFFDGLREGLPHGAAAPDGGAPPGHPRRRQGCGGLQTTSATSPGTRPRAAGVAAARVLHAWRAERRQRLRYRLDRGGGSGHARLSLLREARPRRDREGDVGRGLAGRRAPVDSSSADLLAYRAADVVPANAGPAGAPIRAVSRLAGAVPPSGVTGATFRGGRLFLAGQGWRRVSGLVGGRLGRLAPPRARAARRDGGGRGPPRRSLARGRASLVDRAAGRGADLGSSVALLHLAHGAAEPG